MDLVYIIRDQQLVTNWALPVVKGAPKALFFLHLVIYAHGLSKGYGFKYAIILVMQPTYLIEVPL